MVFYQMDVRELVEPLMAIAEAQSSLARRFEDLAQADPQLRPFAIEQAELEARSRYLATYLRNHHSAMTAKKVASLKSL